MTFVRPEVRDLLAEERDLLGDLAEHLARSGAPEADLREARAGRRGLEETFLLVVVGEFNAGKSSFINALLGAEVLEEGVTPTTDRISILVHGEADRSQPYSEPGPDAGDMARYVVRRELPYRFLEGVALVDTPGTNAVIRRHQALTEGFLPRADLVLFLTSADRPFTESERQFLELARAWGRKVLVVVNKADLLETEEHREEVRSFVARNAREVLGLAPPVFLVSVRRQRREGGDEGFARLEAALRETLGERDRTRLKLLSPLGVALRLAERSRARSVEALDLLKHDTATLSDLERQQVIHASDLERELETHLRGMDAILDGVEKRGELFLDDTMRLSRTLDLLNPDKVRVAFEREVMADAPLQLERRVNEVIDSFIERNIHFWDHVLTFLAERSSGDPASDKTSRLAGARFHYDRQGLLEGLGQSASREIEGFDREVVARRMAEEAQSAVIQSGVAVSGGIGLGGAIVALIGGAAADFTGLLLGTVLIGVGAFILPRRKGLAKAQLKARLAETRARLREVLGREYRLETERAAARLRDATAPYTRFIRAEGERLEGARNEAGELVGRVAALRARVEGS